MQVPSTKLAVAAAVLAAFHALAQTPTPAAPMAADAHPSFAIAAIKSPNPDSRQDGFDIMGDRMNVWNQTVAKMMTFAYGIHKHQILNAPGWVLDEPFDIQGKPDAPGEPSLLQVREMLQKLLADRFGFKFHRERRELPVFALRIAKGGSKLVPAADPTAKSEEHSEGHGLETTRSYVSAPIADFILIEQFFMDRPLVDQTGLTGRYTFKLHYTYDEVRNADPNAPPGLFTAIQDQLGLKFEATRAPVDVLVIDHVNRPSEN
jgi:uncharacterized protein (TIGR03435 family)